MIGLCTIITYTMDTRSLKPMIRIGKTGISEGLLNEIKLQLRKKKVLKIKILKSALEMQKKQEIIQKIIKETKSELMSAVGLTFLLHKR